MITTTAPTNAPLNYQSTIDDHEHEYLKKHSLKNLHTTNEPKKMIYQKIINLVSDMINNDLQKNEKNKYKYFVYNMICNDFLNHNGNIRSKILGNVFNNLHHKDDIKNWWIAFELQYKREYENIKLQKQFEARSKTTKKYKRFVDDESSEELRANPIFQHRYFENPHLIRFKDMLFTDGNDKAIRKHTKNFTGLMILDIAQTIYTNLYNFTYKLYGTNPKNKSLYEMVKGYVEPYIKNDCIYKNIEKIFKSHTITPKHKFIELILSLKRTHKSIRTTAYSNKIMNIFMLSNCKISVQDHNNLYQDIRNHYKDAEYKKYDKMIRPLINEDIQRHHPRQNKKLVLITLLNKTSYKAIAYNFVNNIIFTTTNNIINTFKNRECCICYDNYDTNDYFKCKLCKSSICNICYIKCDTSFTSNYNTTDYDSTTSHNLNYKNCSKCCVCMSLHAVEHIKPNINYKPAPPPSDEEITTFLKLPIDTAKNLCNVLYEVYEKLVKNHAVDQLEYIYNFRFDFMSCFLKPQINEEQYNNICKLQDLQLYEMMFKDLRAKEKFLETYLLSSDFIESLNEYTHENQDDIFETIIYEELDQYDETRPLIEFLKKSADNIKELLNIMFEGDIENDEHEIDTLINYLQNNYDDDNLLEDINDEVFN